MLLKGGPLLYAAGMKFAILRTQKLKSVVAVRRSMKHAFREQATPNADSERTPDNTHIGAQSADEGQAKVAALLPEKRRSDAVLCIEYLVTASPEAMAGKTRAEQDAYLQDALTWIRERHGADNVVYAGIHRDETTPHLYAYAVPLDAETGRLNAKKWLGGAKALSQMQTEFAHTVGQRHGLERGLQGSKATHQRVKQHYGAMRKADEAMPRFSPDELKPQTYNLDNIGGKLLDLVRIKAFKETNEQVADRLTRKARASQAKASAEALEARQRRSEAKDARESLARIRTAAGPFLDAMNGLSPEDRDRLRAVVEVAATKIRDQAAERRKEQIAKRDAELAKWKRGQSRGRGGHGL